jgi:ribosomal protein S18 acetylase RimI-like enzyme
VYRIAPLDPDIERQGFCSGIDPLDRYFHERVSQDVRRRITSCFVALDPDGRIAGFYTLAAASVLLTELPEPVARKLPRYPTVPAIRMDRLAVDRADRNQGLGAALLADALARSIDSGVAAFALVVDAKDETATAFYRHHGFMPLADSPSTLFLPLATVRAIRR